jgi:uncharacterized membrane protein YeaQ/YmgE (transglycosylase-associated protein family)
MLLSVIVSFFIGLVVGALARAIIPGRDPIGCFATALLGVGGSIIGGLIGSVIWPAAAREGLMHPHRLLHFLLAVVGAVILLWLWRVSIGRR